MGRRLASQQETESRYQQVIFWLARCNKRCVTGISAGPQHFAIYINDLDEGTKGMVAKFADDLKIGRKVSCE